MRSIVISSVLFMSVISTNAQVNPLSWFSYKESTEYVKVKSTTYKTEAKEVPLISEDERIKLQDSLYYYSEIIKEIEKKSSKKGILDIVQNLNNTSVGASSSGSIKKKYLPEYNNAKRQISIISGKLRAVKTELIKVPVEVETDSVVYRKFRSSDDKVVERTFLQEYKWLLELPNSDFQEKSYSYPESYKCFESITKPEYKLYGSSNFCGLFKNTEFESIVFINKFELYQSLAAAKKLIIKLAYDKNLYNIQNTEEGKLVLKYLIETSKYSKEDKEKSLRALEVIEDIAFFSKYGTASMLADSYIELEKLAPKDSEVEKKAKNWIKQVENDWNLSEYINNDLINSSQISRPSNKSVEWNLNNFKLLIEYSGTISKLSRTIKIIK